MASAMPKEMAEEFIDFLKDHEPYPSSIWNDFMFDDKRYEDDRLVATQVLECLLRAGYSEDEVNPWKNKH